MHLCTVLDVWQCLYRSPPVKSNEIKKKCHILQITKALVYTNMLDQSSLDKSVPRNHKIPKCFYLGLEMKSFCSLQTRCESVSCNSGVLWICLPPCVYLDKLFWELTHVFQMPTEVRNMSSHLDSDDSHITLRITWAINPTVRYFSFCTFIRNRN